MSDKKDTRTDDSTYDSQYGLNHVTEYPGGYQVQIDSTPGAERMFSRHPSGSYTEISSDGKTIHFNVGDTKTYMKAGFSLTVDENGDIKISGHSRVIVGGGSHIEVAGDAGIFVGGDTAISSMGKVNVRASSVYVGSDSNININAAANMEIKAGGDINMKSGGKIYMNS